MMRKCPKNYYTIHAVQNTPTGFSLQQNVFEINDNHH